MSESWCRDRAGECWGIGNAAPDPECRQTLTDEQFESDASQVQIGPSNLPLTLCLQASGRLSTHRVFVTAYLRGRRLYVPSVWAEASCNAQGEALNADGQQTA